MSVRAIFNADDFGSSSTVNHAVIRAHREGVLTSTSLMAAGEAVDEAVQLAREIPSLAVGLHLVVAGGIPVLPHDQVRHITDRNGRFPDDALRQGLRFAFSRAARAELAAEMAAQFRFFAATGLPFDHVNSHLHIHLHPVVLGLMLPLAREHGVAGFRLPRDQLGSALAVNRRQLGLKFGWFAAFGLLNYYIAKRVQSFPLITTRRVFGLFQTGSMHENYVTHLLGQLHVSTAELYFHPDTGPCPDPLGPNPGDLAALLSPRVRQVLEERGIERSTYSALASEQEGACSWYCSRF